MNIDRIPFSTSISVRSQYNCLCSYSHSLTIRFNPMVFKNMYIIIHICIKLKRHDYSSRDDFIPHPCTYQSVDMAILTINYAQHSTDISCCWIFLFGRICIYLSIIIKKEKLVTNVQITANTDNFIQHFQLKNEIKS